MAQIVMIGIENVHIDPLPLDGHNPLPPELMFRSLWKGQGRTESTRSPRVRLLTPPSWAQSESEIMNAVFLSNLRRLAGDRSSGRGILKGRAVYEEQVKPTVTIVIEHRHAANHGFHEVFPGGLTEIALKGDVAGSRHVGECGQTAQPGLFATGEGCEQQDRDGDQGDHRRNPG